ncbi:hypothetical protein LTR64_005080 [Lithohypha guttulata]|uniref:uncharacterized protein n=1 Tax=Lithohypha guttulata TaxID=1690604 RepID=UPI002DDDF646|nr:hypothetical protein LTR51_005085 [Lithohypha guttulata]
MSNPNPGFGLESWCLYGFGAACVVLRFFSRIRRAGIQHIQLDDYFVSFGLVSYTLLCVAFNEILKGVGSNLMTDEEVAQLTPATTSQRVRASRWVFASEHAMLLTIWSMKAAMLVLYARLTDGVMQRKVLNGVIVWVVLSFVGDEVALCTICRPISQYWAVPVNNPQCASYQYYQIVNAVFNISTDIMLLAVGLPPMLRARLSLQQKLILVVVFGMGSFVVVAAILRAIYCLVPSLVSYIYMNWYFREASVAVYVTNVPAVWVLLRDIFPGLQRLGRSTRETTSGNKGPSHGVACVTPYPTDANLGRNATWMRTAGRGCDGRDLYIIDMDVCPINEAEVTTSSSRLNDGHRGQESQKNASVSSQGGLLGIRRDMTFPVSHIGVKQNV